MRIHIVVITLFLLALAVSGAIYIVDQRQIALVLQFGEPMGSKSTPGLKFKIPLIQNVIYFDKRIQHFNADTTSVIAIDQKNMLVNAFAKYRIVDALVFYQSVQNEEKFRSRFSSILESNMKQVLGSVPFKDVLSPKRPKLMNEIKELAKKEASSFGVEVIDFRIRRADLPDQTREAVYSRMQTDRKKEAAEIRAEGEESAQVIIAKADKDRRVLLAEAHKKAQILRGEGEAESIKITAKAFSKDPKFYEFLRTMQAYKNSIRSENTKMVLTPNSEFMKFFASK